MNPSSPSITINYQPSPTLLRFHQDESKLRFVMGPVGSGKTSANCMEMWRRSLAQAPDRDKRRKTAWSVIRNTVTDLLRTTIPSFQKWIPPSICKINYGSPVTGEISNFPHPSGDGSVVDVRFFFIGMDDEGALKSLDGMEITGAYLNEARHIERRVVTKLLERVGRYPDTDTDPVTGVKLFGPSWAGIIGDTNPPPMHKSHWYYRFAELERPTGWSFFKQPPALILHEGQYVANKGQFPGIPAAENIRYLNDGYKYYFDMLAGKTRDEIRCQICNEYASTFGGIPVWDGIYDDNVHHSVDPLPIYPGLPVLVSFDFGNTPAYLTGQISPEGKLLIQREFQTERSGITQLAVEVLKPMLFNTYGNCPIRGWADASGVAGNQVDLQSPINALCELGIPTLPIPSNHWIPRKEAVIYWMNRRDGFAIDPSCTSLREGCLGGYCFDMIRGSHDETPKEKPTKNRFSHLQDCLQGICMGARDNARQEADSYARPIKKQKSTWGALVG